MCELDLIFHFDEVGSFPPSPLSLPFAPLTPLSPPQQVHTLLSCLITGGLVLDTSLDSIQATFRAQQQAKKHSQAGGGGGGGGAGGLGLGALGEAAGGLLGGERGAFGFGGARARRGR